VVVAADVRTLTPAAALRDYRQRVSPRFRFFMRTIANTMALAVRRSLDSSAGGLVCGMHGGAMIRCKLREATAARRLDLVGFRSDLGLMSNTIQRLRLAFVRVCRSPSGAGVSLLNHRCRGSGHQPLSTASSVHRMAWGNRRGVDDWESRLSSP